MPYIEVNLSPHEPTEEPWALAWCRFLVRDTSDTELYSDAELLATLEAHAFTASNGSTYYRPHVAAASLIVSDPDRALSESLLGSSFQHRHPGDLAKDVRAAGKWIDDLIRTKSEERAPTGRQLTPVF